MSGTPSAKRDKAKEVMAQVEEVKGIMHNNIENLVRNVDNLEVLHDKTETMRDTSNQFKKGTGTLKRKMWWRNMKLNLIIALVVIIIIAIIIIAVVIPLTKK